MPVVNTVEHLYDYQLQRAGLSVLDSVTSTIHQRLHIFRTHHHKCAARRQNALGYELRQESQKTQWLKRKYLDSVRQQQQHQGISERCKMDSVTTAGNRGANSNREVEVVATESSLDCGPVELKANANRVHTDSPPLISTRDVSTPPPPPPPLPPANSLEMDSIIKIKREPGCEATPPPCRTVPNLTKTDNSSSELLKRRMTLTLKPEDSKWKLLNDAEDGRDELKLTAYDVIAGVISTPLLKPLETDLDTTYAGKHSKAAVNKPHCPPTPTAPVVPLSTLSSATTALKGSTKDHHSLDQDLDEFSKVMHQVTQEQIAMERQELKILTTPTSSSSLPPYLPPIGQSCPLEITAQNHFYPRLQAGQPSQVPPLPNHHHHPFKGPPGGGGGNGSTPTSAKTPTTPLEHYSTFPSPPPHMPHPPSMGYSYGNSTTSSMSERWPHPPQPHVTRQGVVSQHPGPTSSQGNLKETIMARVSSRVVTVAGQKRPLADASVPPSKMKGPTSLHQQYPSAPISSSRGHPYQGPSSLTFPHQT